MDKKIIFFDVDGTISKNNKISKLTREAIEKLKNNGHILVLSTGRALPAIDGPLEELNIDNFICSAGGTVVINDEIVYTKPMDKASQKEILDYLDSYGIIYNMETNENIYIKKGHKEKYLELFKIPHKDIVSEKEYENAIKRRKNISKRTKEVEDSSVLNINKIHYYGAELLYEGKSCPLEYQQLVKDLGEKYKCVTLSLGKLFSGGEICAKEISKKTGMEEVLKLFPVAKENIYAIGDDYNDFEMIEFANTGIAMGHAPQEIKEIANYITEDIDNDGFYYAMKHFNLI